MNVKTLAALLAAASLTGCMVGPDYQPPQTQAPTQWHQALNTPTAAPQALDNWWRSFNDPLLTELINEAIAANPELKQTAERIVEARLKRTEVIASGLPSLSARSNVNRRLNNTSSSSLGQSSTGAPGTSSSGGFGVGNQLMNIFQLGFDAQWELDFFGGVQRAVEAADATIEAEQANHDAMQVILLAEVARNYIELRSNQRLQILMQEQLADEQDLVTLTQAREQSGLTSMLDVAEAKAQAANIASQLPVYRIAEEQAVHALSVLLGKEPGALSVRLKNPAAIPQAISIASELPSDLLRRRPDIRQAERALAAANAQIGVATSELYPKINLAAFIGFQNIHITDFTPLGKSWSTAATLSTPIFNWGKLQANVKGTESQFRQAQLTYETTVLTAFKEVEDALVAYVQEQQRHAALQDEIAANQLAVNLSEERYHRGLADFLDVLINRGALLRTQQALVTSDAKLSEQLVALYKAFGGGWQSTNTTP